jgi:hypothetical protein
MKSAVSFYKTLQKKGRGQEADGSYGRRENNSQGLKSLANRSSPLQRTGNIDG